MSASENTEKETLLHPSSSTQHDTHNHNEDEGLLTDDEASTLAQDEDDEDVLKDDYESDDAAETSKGPSQGRAGGVLGRFFRRKSQQDDGPEYHRPSRRHRERKRRGEVQTETMYEMEEGGEASMSSGSSNISEEDLQRIRGPTREKQRGIGKSSIAPTRKKFGRFVNLCCLGLTLVFFLVLLFGSMAMTKKTRTTRKPVPLVSNGTSLFAPTTLLISLDGFRADFLQRGLTPTLNAFIREGVSPLYMRPPFPSVTFVSHYTMATGLWPELHGIVGNSFYEPTFKQTFTYTDSARSMQPKWWGGEPFWVTAENQGVKTAIHMYPGSEAHISGVDLSYVDQFNPDEILDNKAKRVMEWLDLPGPTSQQTIAEAQRPQLIVAYVPDVDVDGHNYGPNSTEIQGTIKRADDMLTTIFAGLTERNLTNIVNVIIVSDHGMATTSVDRLIQLDDLIDMDKIEHTDGWPLWGLRPKDRDDIEPLYQQLKDRAQSNPNIEVYHRDRNMPAEYHFSNNDRIAPLWIVPKTGWALAKKADFDVEKAKQEGLVFHPRGLHGYDYRHPLMRAIFVARGPAFPHQPHSRIEPFDNRNIYNIICDSLHIDPVPNNGTIRLPFTSVGLHSDPDTPTLEAPVDYPDNGHGPPHSISPPSPTTTTTPPQPSASAAIPPEEEKHNKKKPSIWDWFKDTFDDFKHRVGHLFGSKDKEGTHADGKDDQNSS